MKTRITQTTGAFGLGIPTGEKLLRITSGDYVNRQVAVIQTAAGDISFTYADPPHSSWSSLTLVATDTDNQPFDVVMSGNNDLHVVYTETSTQNLVTRKLTFSNGTWSVGSKVTVFYSNPSLNPSVAIESGGKLWVSWTRVSGGLRYVHVKSSTDSGAIWGSGPTDAGDALTTGASAAFAKTIIASADIHVIYTNGGLDISIRSRPISGGSWTAEFDIASGTQFDQHFDAALSTAGALGVVFDHATLKYREYNGEAWGTTVTLDSSGGNYPQVQFNNNIPTVVYLSSQGTGQSLLRYTICSNGSFSTPATLDPRATVFNKVYLYDASAATFEDLTSAASSATTADVLHSASSALVKDIGDILYLGMDDRFRYVKVLLSTAGSGGAVVYSYWDGAAWQGFTPSGGAFNLDSTDKDLTLWQDYDTMPVNWQRTLVNGVFSFWLRVTVTTAFSAAPVGSQLTAISNLNAASVRR